MSSIIHHFHLLQACETLYNMFVSRGLITPMPYGKIILFSLTLVGLLRWYYTTRDTKNLQYTMLRYVKCAVHSTTVPYTKITHF